MNWEMIGAIAESVGALGVIASLVYLAIQIRDGTRATRRTNAHDVNESFRAWWAQLSGREETASIWQRGLTDPKALTSVEQIRFSCHMLPLVTLWEEAFFAADQHDLPKWASSTVEIGRREITSLPGFESWYRERGHWLSPDFRKVLESDMEHGSPHIASHYSESKSIG